MVELVDTRDLKSLACKSVPVQVRFPALEDIKMSRSFKRNPIIKCAGLGKGGRKFANKRVRHDLEIGDGSNYKKLYDRYNIYDVITNLFRRKTVDGIPTMYSGRKMTYNEIMEYWRK